jgi:hypothetical protein
VPLASDSLLDLLLRLPRPQQLDRLEQDARLQTLGLCERLLGFCDEVGPYQSAQVEAAADLALVVAARLPAALAGSRAVADIRTLAGALLSETRFRLFDPEGAGAALVKAKRAARSGTGRPEVRAAVAMSEALLLRGKGLYRPCLARLHRAAKLYRRARATEKLGVALVRTGVLLERLGEVRGARRALAEGVPLLQRREAYGPLIRLGALAIVRLTCGGR